MEFVVLDPATFFQNMEPAWPAIVQFNAIAEPFSKKAKIARVDYRDVAEVLAVT